MPRGFFFLNSETVAEHQKSLLSPVRSCKQWRMRYRPKRSRLGDRQAHLQEFQESSLGNRPPFRRRRKRGPVCNSIGRAWWASRGGLTSDIMSASIARSICRDVEREAS